jgi:acyl-CoA reductase-like NAD-dependent aldehyde dehydrogenase
MRRSAGQQRGLLLEYLLKGGLMANTKSASVPVYEADMLIGGEKVSGNQRIEVRNPAHPDEVIGTIVRGTPDHVDRAVAAAKMVQPAWAAKTFKQRAEVLMRALDKVGDDIENRTILLVRENGKTLADARAELTGVAPNARLTLELATQLDTVHELPAPNGRTVVCYVPYGVVVAIVPWNTPIGLAFLQIIPALFAGNSIILKVPESCPLALIQMAELLASELPPGLLNIVSGLPADIGDALTLHADVGKISFTGSVPSARKIIANAAQTIKGVTAELGGNDAAIVLQDADLGDETMRRMAASVFRSAGQICMAVKRIFVSEKIHDQFIDAFSRAADRIVVGDGLQPGVTMGPMHTASGRDRALRLIADAERQGAKVRILGRVHDETNFAEGYFIRPTVVTEISDEAPLMTEEQFCPAVPVVRYRELDDAIARANATIYGLGGSVWSKDSAKAMAIAQRIQAGTVFVNTHGTNSVNRKAPYGGLKQSGVGRRSGMEGLREYLLPQTLTTFEG